MDATPGWSSSWLDRLDAATRDTLFGLGQHRGVPAGTELTTAGAWGHELVLVLSGRGRVVAAGRIVAYVGAGAFVGEMSLDHRPHSANIVAESPLDVLVFDAAGFRALLAQPVAIHELCRQLVARQQHRGPAIELRALRTGDLAEVCALADRAALYDGVEEVQTVASLRQTLEHPSVDPEHDTQLAVVDGELAGWCHVLHRRGEVRVDRAILIGTVDPHHRGRGVGTVLLAWAVARARERLGQDRGLPRRIRTSAEEGMTDATRLYERFGFAPTRWFEELARPVDDAPSVEVPAGVALVAWPADRDDDLRRVRNEAFGDHWGTEPADAATWHDMARGHGARPELSLAAVDATSDDVVGLCLNHVYPEDEPVTGRRDGWIENVATLAAWRGRGVASAMVARSVQAFADAGLTHARLVVDSDSPTGANRLYGALGFEPARRSIVFELEITERS